MLPTIHDHRPQPLIQVDGLGLALDTVQEIDTIKAPDYRRESSSSRSTSAIISTPLASSENLHEMIRVSSRGDIKDEVVSTRSVRRIGEQERTKTWAQSQVPGQEVGEEDRLLKPPSQESARRPSPICTSHDRVAARLTYSTRRTSRAGTLVQT